MMKLMKGLIVSGAILFLVSCTAYTMTSPPSPNATDVPFTTSATDSVQLPTMTATTLPISSATPLVIPTSTLSALPTEESVVLPTIPPDTVQAFVSELTNDIQNCLLPCLCSIMHCVRDWKHGEAFL
jgi:hypothetical protein